MCERQRRHRFIDGTARVVTLGQFKLQLRLHRQRHRLRQRRLQMFHCFSDASLPTQHPCRGQRPHAAFVGSNPAQHIGSFINAIEPLKQQAKTNPRFIVRRRRHQQLLIQRERMFIIARLRP
ncbi:hypothetical protein D3C81_1009430 [compost metagenome]